MMRPNTMGSFDSMRGLGGPETLGLTSAQREALGKQPLTLRRQTASGGPRQGKPKMTSLVVNFADPVFAIFTPPLNAFEKVQIQEAVTKFGGKAETLKKAWLAPRDPRISDRFYVALGLVGDLLGYWSVDKSGIPGETTGMLTTKQMISALSPTVLAKLAQVGEQNLIPTLLKQATDLYNKVSPLTGMTPEDYEALAAKCGMAADKSFTYAAASAFVDALQAIYDAALKAPQGRTKALLDEAEAYYTNTLLPAKVLTAETYADLSAKTRGNNPWTFSTATLFRNSILSLKTSIAATSTGSGGFQPGFYGSGGGSGGGGGGGVVDEKQPEQKATVAETKEGTGALPWLAAGALALFAFRK